MGGSRNDPGDPSKLGESPLIHKSSHFTGMIYCRRQGSFDPGFLCNIVQEQSCPELELSRAFGSDDDVVLY